MKQYERVHKYSPMPVKNVNRCVVVALLLLLIGVQFFANAQTKKEKDMATVRVRYMVNDLDAAIGFYTKHLGFQVKQQAKPNFAMLALDGVDLVLSTPFGPGGAAKPMADGTKPAAGGNWNRLIINVDNIEAEITRLQEDGVHFRNEIATGPGGAEVLLDDPSGNPIELFQPAATTEQDDETAIRALEDNLIAAFNSGDIDLIMKNYVPGKTFVLYDVVPRKEYLGADVYREAWAEMFTHFEGRPKMTYRDLGITVDGNVGFGNCFMHVTGTDKQGQAVDRWVRVTNGYRKIEGKWLIALEHISVPVNFATGKLVPVTK
jgi:ketosteroid isomerase-like protein/catechol 2,3-dioxygenase-like lactoylglutathione lyase family enzyme